jgi:hypothetical protein
MSRVSNVVATTALLGLTLAGTVAAHAGTTGPATTAAAASSAADPIFTGEHRVVIKRTDSFESVLGINTRGRLVEIDGESPYDVFVLAPVGANEYLVKTADTQPDGTRACVGIRNNGSSPLTIVATICNANRAGQRFSIQEIGADESGRPTYAISNRSAYWMVSRTRGLIAEELGDASPQTFQFVDNGPADRA